MSTVSLVKCCGTQIYVLWDIRSLVPLDLWPDH